MKKFEEEVACLVSFVKERTARSEDKWVVLKRTDILRISGASQYASYRVAPELRRHPNILSKRPVGNGPALYRFVSAEEKIKLGQAANEFNNLTQAELDYIKTVVFETTYNYDLLQQLVSIINVIGLEGGKGSFIPLEPENVADFSLLSNKTVFDAFNLLMEYRLLIKDGECYKLSLSQEALPEAMTP